MPNSVAGNSVAGPTAMSKLPRSLDETVCYRNNANIKDSQRAEQVRDLIISTTVLPLGASLSVQATFDTILSCIDPMQGTYCNIADFILIPVLAAYTYIMVEVKLTWWVRMRHQCQPCLILSQHWTAWQSPAPVNKSSKLKKACKEYYEACMHSNHDLANVFPWLAVKSQSYITYSLHVLSRTYGWQRISLHPFRY